MLEKMEKTKNKSAVIMETHINAYFFLYHHFNELSKDNLYIVVDAYPEMLKMYKKRIEQYNNDLDIVYIAANTMDLPIKEKAVDIFIDFFGINEYSIYNKDFMVPHIYRYLKSKGSVIGTYFSFDEGSKSIKRLNELYPDSFELNFNLKKLIDCFYNNSFTNLKIDRIASTKNSGENPAFTFHIDGENLYLDAYRIEKK
jgi:ubiquinone/menaquinone biosynthesis C-methylase UbiE